MKQVFAFFYLPESDKDIEKIKSIFEKGQPDTKPKEDTKRYVYGLKGICDLFGVAHSTAQKYKDGILKDACYQFGRKIVVDVEKALALFAESEI